MYMNFLYYAERVTLNNYLLIFSILLNHLLLSRLHENLFFCSGNIYYHMIVSFHVKYGIQSCSLHLSLNSTSTSPLTSNGLFIQGSEFTVPHILHLGWFSYKCIPFANFTRYIFSFFGTRLFTNFQNSVGLFPLK